MCVSSHRLCGISPAWCRCSKPVLCSPCGCAFPGVQQAARGTHMPHRLFLRWCFFSLCDLSRLSPFPLPLWGLFPLLNLLQMGLQPSWAVLRAARSSRAAFYILYSLYSLFMSLLVYPLLYTVVSCFPAFRPAIIAAYVPIISPSVSVIVYRLK